MYEVDPLELVEKHIHSLIDWRGFSLHASEQLQNGKIWERAFFKISLETAYGIFKDVATLRGDKEQLRLYVPTPLEPQEEEIAETRTKWGSSSFPLFRMEENGFYFLPADNEKGRLKLQNAKAAYTHYGKEQPLILYFHMK